MIAHKQFDNVSAIMEGERSVIARISTTSVDRDGDVMLPSGLKTNEFRKNPIVLFGHDSGAIPIGKAVGIKRNLNDVVAKVIFADRPENHPDAAEWVPDTIHSLFKQEILRAFSVGFTIDKAREANAKDRNRHGAGVKRVISSWNLLEFSVVPIPANQDALAIAVSKGLLRTSDWAYSELESDWGFAAVEPFDVSSSDRRFKARKAKPFACKVC